MEEGLGETESCRFNTHINAARCELLKSFQHVVFVMVYDQLAKLLAARISVSRIRGDGATYCAS